jgi:ABC-2 type transport system permease protein
MTRPASTLTATATQAAMELRLSSRRGENILVTIIIPVVVLLFFGSIDIVQPPVRQIDFLLGGTMTLAIIATSLVNLGIATAYERNYGVLKRLGGSPLTRSELVTAKMSVILIIEVIQLGLLAAIAMTVFGWDAGASASPAVLVVGLVLGTLAFAGLGLLLAGTLRAEATLAVANGLFLACLLLGGIILPVPDLPGPLATLASFLPAAALADIFRDALGMPATDLGRSVAILTVWGVTSAVLASRTFRWE